MTNPSSANLQRRKASGEPEKRQQKIKDNEEVQHFPRNIRMKHPVDCVIVVDDGVDASDDVREEDEEEVERAKQALQLQRIRRSEHRRFHRSLQDARLMRQTDRPPVG